ncbi:DUF3322 domain-containing protein [Actinomyces glycerinitolerans]|uniref:Wadjet protein JetD C-terminal domain-containing protein n=1 Tax=Actinomyces glycerinitolerans TaxID=1892869 RepID=A0A1M4RY02_9ACTO|nr:DUF3322 domain-containing protein [Actinomyces glycerinitolerans]SHE24809.1 Hypothetical protein ACGLYG10_1018 [Actinomyces glycerinitolerans]
MARTAGSAGTTGSRMRSPQRVRELLAVRYRRGVVNWLAGADSEWPLTLPLHPPTAAQARRAPADVADWIAAWERAASGALPWRVSIEERAWSGFGRQRVPVRVVVDGPSAVARLTGNLEDWNLLDGRVDHLTRRWGAGADAVRQVCASAIGRVLAAVRQCDAEDFDRALRVIDWLTAHPDSGLLLRQVPVEGMDTKWLEHHRALVQTLLEARRHLGDLPGGRELGLRREERPRDVVVLDPVLRPRAPGALVTAGIRHLRLDTKQLTTMWTAGTRPAPGVVVVCENRQSLLSLPDLDGVIAVHGGGYAVDVLGMLPWATGLPLVYWGDLDQDGFAILDRLRHHHGNVTSVLMDTATLEHHRTLCVPDPHPQVGRATRLTPAEEETRTALLDAGGVRLEQERIAWDWAEPRLRAAVARARGRRRTSGPPGV